MKIVQEFKDFAVKRIMIDIAIGVIIGATFNTLVNVLVKQILMPPLSVLTGGSNWSTKKLVLKEAVIEGDKVTGEEISMGYGLLIDASIDFLVIAIIVFIVIKLMNKIKRKAEDPKDTTVKTPKDIELLTDVKELLEQQNELLKNQK
tara:strand:- start:5534 stop:5974 length:441 start_codon:yes stop_codon:yes gene_type:complete